MMKINNFIKKIIVNLLVILILASCNIDVEWNGKFQDDLGRYIITPVTFFAKDTDTYGQSFDFIIGEKIIASDLPDHKDPKIWELKPGYINKGWTLKTEDIDFDLDYANKADGTIEYFVVPRHSLSFYGNWEPCKDTPYKIDYQWESLKDNDVFDHKEFETRYGVTDTTVTLSVADIKPYEGFTASESLPSGTIDGRGTTVFSVQYKRNESSLNFHNMASYDNQQYQVRGKYGKDVNLTKWPDNSKSGYKFYGWTTQATDEVIKNNSNEANAIIEKEIPKKFPPTYIDYYPVFGPEVYDLTFKDQFGKTISGTFDETKQWSYAGTDLSLDSPSGVDSDVAEFEGWYVNNSDCDDPTAKLDSSGSNWSLPVDKLNGTNVVLYAKWKYIKIYVDPENGSDENKGMAITSALKTIAEAKKYVETDTQIILLSAVKSVEDVENLSGLGTKLKRYATTYPFVDFSGTMDSAKPLTDITLEGEAKFVKDDLNGTLLFSDGKYNNEGKTSSTALIVNKGTMYIGNNVILQNNHNTGSTGGGAIYSSGSLSIVATTGNEVGICRNYATNSSDGKGGSGGGIEFFSSGFLTLENVKINNNGASNTAGTSGQGGAIRIASSSSTKPVVTLTNVEMKNNRSATSGGAVNLSGLGNSTSDVVVNFKNVSIENNVTCNKNGVDGSGGGIYIIGSKLNIEDSSIISNSAGDCGGGITSNASSTTVKNSEIRDNRSVKDGGGISIKGASGYVTLSGNTKLINNSCGVTDDSGTFTSLGLGQSVYISTVYIIFEDTAYTDSTKDIYFKDNIKNPIRVNSNTNLAPSSYIENANIIALITPESVGDSNPKSYTNGKEVIMGSGGNFASLFKVSDSPDGKKWAIKQESENSNGILDCISSDAGGSGIVNPLEQTVTASLDGSRIVVKYNGTIVKPDTISISIYYYGTLTDTPLTDTKYADPDSSDSISLPADYPSGTYDLDVSGTYNGVPFFATLQMTK